MTLDFGRTLRFIKSNLWFKNFMLLGCLLGAMWIFIEVADEVKEQDSLLMEEKILLFFREPGNLGDPIGPFWVEQIARDITTFGGFFFVISITLATAGLLFLLRKKREAWYCIAAVGSGTLVMTLMKNVFARSRPDIVEHAMQTGSFSFPSGHSALGTMTLLTLAIMATSVLHSKRTKVYVVSLALIMSALVAISRVYLGVHWPTDVLAGFSLGIFWAVLWFFIQNVLKKKGTA